MSDRIYTQTIHLGPTLAANHTFNFVMANNATLLHVSLCNSTANAGSLKIGNATDDDYYLLAESFGVSGIPAKVSTPAGFDGVGAGGQYPHILDGSVVSLLITDHASHMANVCVILTWSEG